ncbi:MAG: n-acetylglutamate synthase [Deltaproteobacteria bacterium]|nr:n-acetylglutamate synthase [Deltaproteobacteria bacterium]
MARIHYGGKTFRSASNSTSGEVSGETLFHYHQEDDLVWATYSGGAIRFGNLVAKVLEGDVLDMRYQHLNRQGELKTGICRSTPQLLADGRIRLHEEWRWTSGDQSTGESTLEEV